MNTINKKFDSLTAFSAWLQASPVCGYFANHELKSQDNDEYFRGSKSWEEANNLMLHGWHEGAARVAAYMSGGVRGRADQAQNYYSPVGFAPSVGRYLSGHPCNMINRRKVSVPAPVVSIVYNSSVAASVDASDIEKTAARLFNVVAGLERSGVRVELWNMDISRGTDDKEQINFAVKIKSAGQPFNLLKMIYPVVHPSFLRRHFFACVERCGVGRGHRNYGYVISNKTEIEKAIKELRINNAVILSFDEIRGKSEKEIKDMIK